MPLKTREDILYAMSAWALESGFMLPLAGGQLKERIDQVVEMAKQWHADSVIMHLNRGCEGLASGQMSVRRALVASGIPTLAYEGNMGDRRDFNEAETLGRIEAFMGMLGLERLTQK